MKNFILAIFIFLGFITQVNAQETKNIQFKNFKQLQQFLKYTGKNTPLVSAHRGGPTAGFPENCTATFENTIKNNQAIIETDVSITKDSVLVMMHDNNLARTSTGTGKISEHTYAELQAYFLKDNEGKITSNKIQTLDEILNWGKDKVVYTLDVKRGVPYKMVVDAVKKQKAENFCIIITYNANQAAEVAKLNSKVMISVSVRSKTDVDRLVEMGVNKENIVAFIGTSAPDDATLDYFHNEKIGLILGTMGNIDKSAAANSDKLYLDLIKKGIFVLSSDRPNSVNEQIAVYISEKK